MDKLAIVDIETTGATPQSDRVIELGVVLVDGGRVSQTWETLVNPRRSISPIITSITGIAQGDLLDAPGFEDVGGKLMELLEDRVFVAHNVRFDYGFLKYEFSRLGWEFMRPQLCSVRLSRALYPEHRHHGLDAIINRFGIDVGGRHRALADALAVWEFMERAVAEKKKRQVMAAMEEITSRPALPPNLPKSEIDKLPNSPGVYLFYGEDDELLYVGKSVRIRERVWSHFYADLVVRKEQLIKDKVRRIEAQTTAGELSALLLESRLIKELGPTYNRMLRKKRQMLLVKLEKDKLGYLRVKMERSGMPEVADLNHVYGVFNNKRQALARLTKLSKQHELCDKLAGLESGKGVCFGYHLGTCKGACLGKESAESYNRRLVAAMEETRIAMWPFEQPVVVYENDETTGQESYHVFDKWCHVGTTNDMSQVKAVADSPTNLEFDWDTYHIVKKYLRVPEAQVVPIEEINEDF